MVFLSKKLIVFNIFQKYFSSLVDMFFANLVDINHVVFSPSIVYRQSFSKKHLSSGYLKTNISIKISKLNFLWLLRFFLFYFWESKILYFSLNNMLRTELLGGQAIYWGTFYSCCDWELITQSIKALLPSLRRTERHMFETCLTWLTYYQ